jgi:hypothetical protein
VAQLPGFGLRPSASHQLSPCAAVYPSTPQSTPPLQPDHFVASLGNAMPHLGRDVDFPIVEWVGQGPCWGGPPSIPMGTGILLCRGSGGCTTGAVCGASTDCPTASTARSAAVTGREGVARCACGRQEVPCTLWLVAGCLQVLMGGVDRCIVGTCRSQSGRLWYSHVVWQFQPQQVLGQSTCWVPFSASVQPQAQQRRLLGKGCVLGMSSVLTDRGCQQTHHG